MTFKKVYSNVHPYEVEITRLFSTAPLSSNPRNHCVPLYEVLDVPDDANAHILVFPFLRKFNDPDFETVGETVQCFEQIFEVISFL